MAGAAACEKTNVRAPEADSERAPRAAHTVYRDGTHRIVNANFIEEENRQDHEQTAKKPRDEREGRRHDVTARGNRHQARERPVEGKGGVRLLEQQPRQERRSDSTARRGDIGVRGNHGQGATLDGGRTTGVKAKPPEPEDEHAQGCERQTVSGDRTHLAVLEFAEAGPHDDGSCETDPTAHRVDYRGSGEVEEPLGLQPTLAAQAEEAIPAPATENRVDDGRNDQGWQRGKRQTWCALRGNR